MLEEAVIETTIEAGAQEVVDTTEAVLEEDQITMLTPRKTQKHSERPQQKTSNSTMSLKHRDVVEEGAEVVEEQIVLQINEIVEVVARIIIRMLLISQRSIKKKLYRKMATKISSTNQKHRRKSRVLRDLKIGSQD